jgi:N-acetylmuramoyl-L-alanine amidase
MHRKLIAILGLVALTAAAAQTVQSDTLQVSAVRFWTFEDTTRVAIEVSGEFEYHVERLHNPERIFFDIKNARVSLSGKKSSLITVDDKLLRRIRVAETLPGKTRIVLDLTVAAEFTASQLANPDRLMVELRRGAAPAIPVVSESRTAPAITPPSAPALPVATDAKPARAEAAPAALPEPPAGVLDTRKPTARPDAQVTPGETGQAARRNSDGRSSLTRALGLKVTRVVIDPGHGGHDQGTVGPHGFTEKELVLDVAQRLGKLIEERMGSEVIYTRSDDTFIPLEGRTRLANEKKADLFISVHANSSPILSIRGVETYYLNFTSAKDALDVASRENASSQKSIFELRDLIQQITLHEKLDESKEFANRVQSSLQTFEHTYSPTSKNRGIKKAPFVVLIGANMPSILTEIGFLSNAREEALLRRPDHRQKLAEALYRGASKYAQSLSHFEVAQNQDGQ